MSILVVVAHPDDEVLGCGASIAKWNKAGIDVHVMILAEGATSRHLERSRESYTKELTELSQAAQTAGKILGVASIKMLDFPDNRMDSVNRLDVIKAIEKHIMQVKPETVVTHHAGDVNIDHQIIHEAVVTACRPEPRHPVRRLLAFEVNSSTEWQPPSSARQFKPNWFEDVSQTFDCKLKALEAYSPEIRPWPHSRSIKAVEHLGRWRGASVGVEVAEAFMLMRFVI